MIHRRLVDAERFRKGGLRELLVAVAHEEREHVSLFSGEPRAITDPQERERDLLVRLVVHVRRGDAFEDADEQRCAIHEPGPTRDVETQVRASRAFLSDVRTDLARNVQQAERVTHLDTASRHAELPPEFHHLRTRLTTLAMHGQNEY